MFGRFRKKTGLRTASEATIAEQLLRIQAQISNATERANSVPVLEARVASLKKLIAATQAKIVYFEAMRRPKRGLIGKLLGVFEFTPEVAAELDRLRRRVVDLDYDLGRAANDRAQAEYSRDQLPRLIDKADGIQREIERRNRKREKINDLRAAASQNVQKTRSLARAIREQLERQSGCPYCGYSLGESSHADHIYPVSKGGRSTIRNMVLVCASCNARKGDLTLAAFVQKFDLDRRQIEERLSLLGKEF